MTFLSRFRRPLLAVALLGVVAASALAADWYRAIPDDAPLAYVGRASCIDCHQQEARLWTGSHHDLAMDLATDETVLGDFNNATLEHHGVASRMFRRDGKFFVHTEGPDGRMDDFEVRYVLGVTPLQQYMVEFDRGPDQADDEIARLQVLRISWDTLAKQWFHLDPPDVRDRLAPDDDLHWTGILQRWNNMCADCHSTNLLKRFDPKTNSYHTTFSEIDVSCEACHGPGNLHVQLARRWSPFWDRKRGYALAKLKGESNLPEIQACAPCHSRRTLVSPDYHAGDNYYDGFHNELLGDLTYHADGQILDEVYEYGSFTQSKMFHKGIKCSNCHDPHSLQVRFPDNRLCTSCHAHPAGKYDGPGHHHHEPAGSGSKCVNCHMPVTKYMAVDPRRDHSLRVPRPGLSVELGTPNACTGCHLEVDRSLAKLPPSDSREPLTQYADWLRLAPQDAAVRGELDRLNRWSHSAALKWWGLKADDKKHYAHTFHAARTRQADAPRRLRELAQLRTAPAIVRATALDNLARFGTPDALAAADKLYQDDDPQIQLAALSAYDAQLSAAEESIDPQSPGELLRSVYRPLLRPLIDSLSSRHRATRHTAARLAMRVPAPVRNDLLDHRDRALLESTVDELIAAQAVHADRAGSHMLIAFLREAQGDERAAEAAYRTAIRVEPGAIGPRANLAGLLERRGEPHAAEAKQLRAAELPLLERDARLAPQLVEVQYRYAMGLYLNGRESDAEKVLLAASQLSPSSPRVWLALMLLYEKQKRTEDARKAREKLEELEN